MSPEMLADLLNRLSTVETSVQGITKTVTALKLDSNKWISANQLIPPGIACKIAYDGNGLVLKGSPLEGSDIPNIQISQVVGLENALKSVVDEERIKQIQTEMKNLVTKRSSVVVGTATKVNYDANGYIVSTADLGADDIPTLPISKIEGLSDIINIIQSMSTSPIVSTEKLATINPGTYPKITYDANGRVVSGAKLSVDDIPMEVISRINQLESTIPDLASQIAVSGLTEMITKKVDGNLPISPGIYTKVHVDSKGLVTKGEKITKTDLPQLDIDDIPGLRETLKKTVTYDDIIEIRNSISTILSSIQNIGDMTKIKNDLTMKASNEKVTILANELSSMKKLMETLQEKIPNELIMNQLQQITAEISTLAGKVSVIEKKLEIQN